MERDLAMVRNVFALTTRGLEGVSAEEMTAHRRLSVDEVGYRRVAAQCSGQLGLLLGLRTVDDVFLHLATWSGVGHRREELRTIGRISGELEVAEAACAVAELRPIRTPAAFSVTANFVGRRNYSSDEIKDAVGGAISASAGWRYEEDDRAADLNVRVFIEHETAFVGIRLAERPLQQRAYKVAHVPGSLKPPVAAALLRLGKASAGLRVLDPCCGAGTIVIEAALMGAQAHGGDIDPTAVGAARTNAARAALGGSASVWDAMALPVPTGSVDLVVSNLPWGREVEVDMPLRTFYERVGVEIERAIGAEGRAVLLTDAPEQLRFSGLRLADRREISLHGRRPSVMVFAR